MVSLPASEGGRVVSSLRPEAWASARGSRPSLVMDPLKEVGLWRREEKVSGLDVGIGCKVRVRILGSAHLSLRCGWV